MLCYLDARVMNRTEIMHALQQYLYLNIYIRKHYCNPVSSAIKDKKYNSNPLCTFSYHELFTNDSLMLIILYI